MLWELADRDVSLLLDNEDADRELELNELGELLDTPTLEELDELELFELDDELLELLFEEDDGELDELLLLALLSELPELRLELSDSELDDFELELLCEDRVLEPEESEIERLLLELDPGTTDDGLEELDLLSLLTEVLLELLLESELADESLDDLLDELLLLDELELLLLLEFEDCDDEPVETVEDTARELELDLLESLNGVLDELADVSEVVENPTLDELDWLDGLLLMLVLLPLNARDELLDDSETEDELAELGDDEMLVLEADENATELTELRLLGVLDDLEDELLLDSENELLLGDETEVLEKLLLLVLLWDELERLDWLLDADVSDFEELDDVNCTDDWLLELDDLVLLLDELLEIEVEDSDETLVLDAVELDELSWDRLELLDELNEMLMDDRLLELLDDEDSDDLVELDGELELVLRLVEMLLDELFEESDVSLELELVCGLDELLLFVLEDELDELMLDDSDVLLLECPVELELDELELDELAPNASPLLLELLTLEV